eukprot:16938-Heterococcus_DN1.PRE.1
MSDCIAHNEQQKERVHEDDGARSERVMTLEEHESKKKTKSINEGECKSDETLASEHGCVPDEDCRYFDASLTVIVMGASGDLAKKK